MTTPRTCAEAVARRSFMAGRPIDLAVTFDFLEQASPLERRGSLGDSRRTQARVPDHVGPRRRPMVPDHTQDMPLIDLGQIQMLRTC